MRRWFRTLNYKFSGQGTYFAAKAGEWANNSGMKVFSLVNHHCKGEKLVKFVLPEAWFLLSYYNITTGCKSCLVTLQLKTTQGRERAGNFNEMCPGAGGSNPISQYSECCTLKSMKFKKSEQSFRISVRILLQLNL